MEKSSIFCTTIHTHTHTHTQTIHIKMNESKICGHFLCSCSQWYINDVVKMNRNEIMATYETGSILEENKKKQSEKSTAKAKQKTTEMSNQTWKRDKHLG